MRKENPFRKNASFAVGVAFTVVEGILSGCSYLSIYFCLKTVERGNAAWSDFLWVTGLLAAIFVLRLVIYGTGYTRLQVGGAAVSRKMRLILGDKFKRIPLARFTKGQVGQYVNTQTSDVNNYEKILTHNTGNIAKNVTLSLMLILFVATLYLPAGLIMLAVSLMLIPNQWMSFRVVKRYGRHKNEVSAETVSSIVEYVTGIQTFRAYGAGGTRNRAVTEAMREYSDVCYQYEAKGIPVGFGFNIFCWLMVPVVIAAAAVPWTEGRLGNVDFLLICMLPILLTKLLASLSIDLFSWKNLMISKKNIQKIMEEPEEQTETERFLPKDHEIRFRGVDFSYVQGEPVLRGISFTVPDKKLTAIVGDSGSGKSTILNLIAGYYEADGGEITIGGQSVREASAEQVLSRISMVDQECFLFNDTVRENIRHARPDATDEEIGAACREAGCDGFIRRMEQGYDTPVGENGSSLSGGERQRLSIARAILKDSPILLLDEATASLDIENELAVRQAIANLLKRRKTVVMIAHTLSIVKGADQILVVENGKMGEAGTHEELLAAGGKYAAMWEAEQRLAVG